MAEASTPDLSSPSDPPAVLDANGMPLNYNPELEKRSWPRFLENLSMRILLLCVAAALIPVSIGVVWFTDIPRWEVLVMGGSSGLSLLASGICLNYVIKGKWTKHDLNVQVAMSAAALTANYSINNPYTYRKPY